MSDSCSSCRFFHPPGATVQPGMGAVGTCRYEPPKPVQFSGNLGLQLAWNWPPVTTGDWCGKHEAKEDRIERKSLEDAEQMIASQGKEIDRLRGTAIGQDPKVAEADKRIKAAEQKARR